MKKLLCILLLLAAGHCFVQSGFAQVINNAAIVNFYGQATQSNPPVNIGKVYFDKASGQLKCLKSDGTSCLPAPGTGTLTGFSSGNASPLFTTSVANPTTTPALSFTLLSAAADSILGNFTGGSAAPTYAALVSCSAGGSALTYNTSTHAFGCNTIVSGVSSFTGDGTIFNNSASTGAVTATLANTPTGTGGVVLATSPTLVTPALGTPSAVVLTNGTGLPESGVTNLTSDLALKAPLASPTFTGTVTLPTVTNTGVFTNSQNGAASASAFNFTGTPFAGTGTTSTPLVYINAGTAPTTFAAAGTAFGINLASGSTANAIDVHLNGGASIFSLASNGSVLISNNFGAGGNVNAGGSATNGWSGRSVMSSPANGVVDMQNNAQTAFTRLDFGGTTSSFAALGTSGTTITAQLADGTAGGTFSESLGGRFACTHGTNGTCGVSTLASGTVTVSTTAIAALAAAGAAGDVVVLTLESCSSCGALSVGTVTAATSFVINSTNASDASNVYWEIKHVN